MDMLHSWIDTFLELLVVVILIAEYLFDRNQVIKQANKMKQRTKRHLQFERLTIGEHQ